MGIDVSKYVSDLGGFPSGQSGTDIPIVDSAAYPVDGALFIRTSDNTIWQFQISVGDYVELANTGGGGTYVTTDGSVPSLNADTVFPTIAVDQSVFIKIDTKEIYVAIGGVWVLFVPSATFPIIYPTRTIVADYIIDPATDYYILVDIATAAANVKVILPASIHAVDGQVFVIKIIPPADVRFQLLIQAGVGTVIENGLGSISIAAIAPFHSYTFLYSNGVYNIVSVY